MIDDHQKRAEDVIHQLAPHAGLNSEIIVRAGYLSGLIEKALRESVRNAFNTAADIVESADRYEPLDPDGLIEKLLYYIRLRRDIECGKAAVEERQAK